MLRPNWLIEVVVPMRRLLVKYCFVPEPFKYWRLRALRFPTVVLPVAKMFDAFKKLVRERFEPVALVKTSAPRAVLPSVVLPEAKMLPAFK